jgi:arginyl-tRNA synthetase
MCRQTKKKFSSRAGAASVVGLLNGAIEHFEKKFLSDGELPKEEAQRAAHQLGVGSIILNDIKKDRKNNVDIFVELQRSVEEFEKSGGAYIMYSACRAASIVRKYGKELPAIETIKDVALDPSEAEILKRIADLPFRAKAAALQDDPSLLAQALLELSRLYNTYYNAFPVLRGGEVHEHRLLLTNAVSMALRNGLSICHINCPDRI